MASAEHSAPWLKGVTLDGGSRDYCWPACWNSGLILMSGAVQYYARGVQVEATLKFRDLYRPIGYLLPLQHLHHRLRRRRRRRPPRASWGCSIIASPPPSFFIPFFLKEEEESRKNIFFLIPAALGGSCRCFKSRPAAYPGNVGGFLPRLRAVRPCSTFHGHIESFFFFCLSV